MNKKPKQKISKADKKVRESFEKKNKIKKTYYESIIIALLTFIIFLSSAIFFYNAYFNYTPPAFFVVLNEDNRVLEDTPITEPVLSEAELNNLVNEWISDIFSYHYLNLDSHGAKIRGYFATDQAYSDFMETFNGLRFQQRVRGLRGIVIPKIIEPIIVDSTSIYNNHRRIYQMKGTYIVEIRSSEGVEPQRYNITVVVSRRSLTERPTGYGIEAIAIR